MLRREPADEAGVLNDGDAKVDPLCVQDVDRDLELVGPQPSVSPARWAGKTPPFSPRVDGRLASVLAAEVEVFDATDIGRVALEGIESTWLDASERAAITRKFEGVLAGLWPRGWTAVVPVQAPILVGPARSRPSGRATVLSRVIGDTCHQPVA